MQLYKIVITGGPCAGKSAAMSRIGETFSRLGYTVLYIPETATELIHGGVAPWTCGTRDDFQDGLTRLQLAKEAVFTRAARTMQAEKILLVCDRGVMDAKAYMGEERFAAMLRELGQCEETLRNGYDAVFHLVTAARGAEDFYTTQNNTARIETPAEARELDDRVAAAWQGHPCRRIIESNTDFEGKLRHLLTEIASFLGEKGPYEIERKFLIAYPEPERLIKTYAGSRAEILQTYLKTADGVEMRVRRYRKEEAESYYLTTKRRISAVCREETEERISEEEYLRHLADADPERRPLYKERYELSYREQFFEIDIYPFWHDRAILEIELNNESVPIVFPPELRILREVTEDPAYRNAALAKKIPLDIPQRKR